MWLLAGLGNPGARYEHTRHNIGFSVIDAIASRYAFPAFSKKFKGLAAQGSLDTPTLLLKPQTFMNLSGESVQEAMQFYKIPPAQLIVLHDEIDLPTGEVKLKKGGGTAGHNGLKSIAAQLGEDFGRIRIGVGHPRGTMKDVSDHVLEPFSKDERSVVEEITALLAQHIAACVSLFTDENFANRKFIAPREEVGFDVFLPGTQPKDKK